MNEMFDIWKNDAILVGENVIFKRDDVEIVWKRCPNLKKKLSVGRIRNNIEQNIDPNSKNTSQHVSLIVNNVLITLHKLDNLGSNNPHHVLRNVLMFENCDNVTKQIIPYVFETNKIHHNKHENSHLVTRQ